MYVVMHRLFHICISVVGRGHKGLLDGSWDYPADEVEFAAGLVVGARSA